MDDPKSKPVLEATEKFERYLQSLQMPEETLDYLAPLKRLAAFPEGREVLQVAEKLRIRIKVSGLDHRGMDGLYRKNNNSIVFLIVVPLRKTMSL